MLCTPLKSGDYFVATSHTTNDLLTSYISDALHLIMHRTIRLTGYTGPLIPHPIPSPLAYSLMHC